MTLNGLAWELVILIERGLTDRTFPETTVKHYHLYSRRQRGKSI